jgi:hypothetical protein
MSNREHLAWQAFFVFRAAIQEREAKAAESQRAFRGKRS